MVEASPSIERIPGYCSLCISRCGSIATVEGGRFVALDLAMRNPEPMSPQTRTVIQAIWRTLPVLDELQLPMTLYWNYGPGVTDQAVRLIERANQMIR